MSPLCRCEVFSGWPGIFARLTERKWRSQRNNQRDTEECSYLLFRFLKGWLTLPLASSAANWKKTTQNVGKCITKYTESCSKETSCYPLSSGRKGQFLAKIKFTWTQRNVKTYSRLTKQSGNRGEKVYRIDCRPGIHEALWNCFQVPCGVGNWLVPKRIRKYLLGTCMII